MTFTLQTESGLLQVRGILRHFAALLFGIPLLLVALGVGADNARISTDQEEQPQVHLYFLWSLPRPHYAATHPYVLAIPQQRPWVRLHALEVSRNPENARPD